MEKYVEYLIAAERKIRTIDHLIYMTYPLIKDKRLLLKIMSEMNLIIISIINAVLQYEYLFKRIDLTKNANTNLNLFFQKCTPRYQINESEIRIIKELLDLQEKHKRSSMEFVKNGKVVILSGNLKTDILTVEKIKEFLFSIKIILKKVQKVINKI